MRSDDYHVMVISSGVISIGTAVQNAIAEINTRLGTIVNISQSQSSNVANIIVTVTIVYTIGRAN